MTRTWDRRESLPDVRNDRNPNRGLEIKDMSKSTESSQLSAIQLFEEALPDSLFERLVRAVRSIPREEMNGSYKRTFWFPFDQEPTHVIEETILELVRMVAPRSECIGMEWWIGRLAYGRKLRFHFDRDLTLQKMTGENVHPFRGSVLYLNSFPSSPTVIVDQVLGPDGETKIPEKPEASKAIEPVANRYIVFPGGLLHGVAPDPDKPKPAAGSKGEGGGSNRRLSLLVNYWDRRPMPPTCADYDGSVYPILRNQ
jgi:hypothetical protein